MITKSKQMFRLDPVRSAPEAGVDRNKNVIYGCVVMQAGPINDDRPYFVDETTLDQVVALGNRSRNGLKSRFTHPNLSNDGLGSHLGRFKNFRRDGDSVRADLYVADVAFESPRGDMGSYVLDLAEEDPESFGVSLATIFDEEGMDAARQEMEEREEDTSRIPLRFSRIHACDFVGDPAATRDGLFADRLSEATLADYATMIMDKFFAGATKDHVRGRVEDFLSKYYSGGIEMSHEEQNQEFEESTVVAEAATEVITEEEATITEDVVEDEATQEQEAQVELAASHEDYISHFGAQGAVWFLEGKSFQECLLLTMQAMQATLSELSNDKQQLETRLEAALQASGEIEPLSAEPIDEKGLKLAAKIESGRKKGMAPSTAAWAAALYDKDS